MNKKLNSKYSQKHLDQAKTSTTDVLKTALIKTIQKIVKATDSLIVNKRPIEIIKFPISFPQNSLGTVRNETENIEIDKDISRKKLLMIRD